MKCQECGCKANYKVVSNGNPLCEKHAGYIRCKTWVVSIEFYNELIDLYNKKMSAAKPKKRRIFIIN